MRLIDANAINYVTGITDIDDLNYVRRYEIDRMPTIDAVPVVRCRECKWWGQIDNGSYGYCHACKHSFYSSNWEISIYRRYKEDWFCADGEREQK